MALKESMLAEEILSRPERAVLRSVYRVQTLSESIQVIDKISKSFESEQDESGISSSSLPYQSQERMRSIRSYLVTALCSALEATNVPGKSPETKKVILKPQGQ